MPADVVCLWSALRPSSSRTLGAAPLGPFSVASSTRIRFCIVLVAPAGNHLRWPFREVRRDAMLEESLDDQQIIERVAALDIGKAELVCCVRLPGPGGSRRRLQEVITYSTMTPSLQVMAERLLDLG